MTSQTREPSVAVNTSWGDGDYATAGDLWAGVGQRLVDAVGVAGLDVLDLATGTGATAIAAAHAGGRVTALDVTPELLAVARARAQAAGLQIRWVEGDMMRAPLPNAAFDRVLSTFGVMFADDPRAMARELVRLCRPGGLIASCAWTPKGAFGRIAPTVAAFLPGRAAPATAPTDWSTLHARDFFAGQPVDCATETRTVRIRWPSLAAAVATFEQKPGPIQTMRRALEPLGRWPEARAALAELFRRFANQDSAGLAVDVEYLVLLVCRR